MLAVVVFTLVCCGEPAFGARHRCRVFNPVCYCVTGPTDFHAAQELAVRELRRLGADVECLGSDVVYVSVWPRGRGASVKFSDADLSNVKGLTAIERIALGDTQISDQGLAHLKNLSHLKHLTLFGAPVTDDGLAHIRKLARLETLSLTGTEVGDAGMKVLKDLPRLTFLNLSGTRVTDAGANHLKDMTQLTDLRLSGTNITDAGVAELSRLANLETLGLDYTNITNDGLAHLKPLTRLRNLGLARLEISETGVAHLKELNIESLSYEKCKISDATAASFAQLTNLKWLNLVNCWGLDQQQVKKLQELLPKTQVSYFYAHD